MLTLEHALLAILFLGHGVLWIGLVNRTHALALPRPLLKFLDIPNMLILLGAPLGVAWLCIRDPRTPMRMLQAARSDRWFACYLLLCTVVGIVTIAVWLRRKLQSTPKVLLAEHSHTMNVAERLGERPIGDLVTTCLDWVPGNQMLVLRQNERQLQFDHLDGALDGLSIAHLSDLHFCGKITRPFFEVVVEQTNAMDVDIIAITGDIFDKARYMDWIPTLLGGLKCRYGVFFVLGNHDKRIRGTQALRKRIMEVGPIDMGGKWHVVPVRDREILIAGNELPWFGPVPDVPARDPNDDAVPFRLLLAHTPDQVHWARRHHFDLMLAGHTHGGQIRLPIIGPLFAPSLHGLKYAESLHHEPPTVLHVSRGISGLDPVRWNCPPEITKLVLRSAE